MLNQLQHSATRERFRYLKVGSSAAAGLAVRLTVQKHVQSVTDLELNKVLPCTSAENAAKQTRFPVKAAAEFLLEHLKGK